MYDYYYWVIGKMYVLSKFCYSELFLSIHILNLLVPGHYVFCNIGNFYNTLSPNPLVYPIYRFEMADYSPFIKYLYQE